LFIFQTDRKYHLPSYFQFSSKYLRNNYNGRAYVAAAGTEWPRNLSLAQREKPKTLDTRSSGGSVAAKQGSHLKQVTNDYWEIGVFNND